MLAFCFFYTTCLAFPESDDYLICSNILLIHSTTKTLYFQTRNYSTYGESSVTLASHTTSFNTILITSKWDLLLGFSHTFKSILLNPTITTQNITFDYHWRQDRLNYNKFDKLSVLFINYLSHWQNFHTIVRGEGWDRSYRCLLCPPSLNKAEGGPGNLNSCVQLLSLSY